MTAEESDNTNTRPGGYEGKGKLTQEENKMKHITMDGIKYTITECFAIKRNDESYPFHTNALLINAELENGETVKHVVFGWKIPETNTEFSDMMNDTNAWENFGEDHEIKEVEYAVNITTNGETKVYDNDHYDWYDTFEEAYNAAQDVIADPETAEVDIMKTVGGEFDDLHINLIREGGKVNEYRNGELCWL